MTALEQELPLPRRRPTASPPVASSRTGDARPRNWVCNCLLQPDLQAKNLSAYISHAYFLPSIPFSVTPAANMNVPYSDVSAASANLSNAVMTSKVSELARVCVGLGMAPPEFSYIGNRQVTACNPCFSFETTHLKSLMFSCISHTFHKYL